MQIRRTAIRTVILLFGSIGYLLIISETLKIIKDVFMDNSVNFVYQCYVKCFWVLVMISLIYAVKRAIRECKTIFQVESLDTKIELSTKDMFKLKGAIVVPINNQFKVDPKGKILKADSVLAQTIKKYFDSQPDLLQNKLNKELGNPQYSNQQNNGCYDVGTVVKIHAKDRDLYFFANSALNERSTVEPINQELMKQGLYDLWNFLSKAGDRDDYVVPLFGTGYGHVTSRSATYKQILVSYLNSIGNHVYTKKLTICIHPTDLKKFEINLDELLQFTNYTTKYYHNIKEIA